MRIEFHDSSIALQREACHVMGSILILILIPRKIFVLMGSHFHYYYFSFSYRPCVVCGAEAG